MSEEAVAALDGLIAAFNEGGIGAALEYADPKIQWWAPPEWLEDRLYAGHEGVSRLAAFWIEQFDEYRLEPEKLIDLGGGRALALLHQRGNIKGSSVSIDQPIGWLVQFDAGKVTEVHVYFSWEAALEAAGLPVDR